MRRKRAPGAGNTRELRVMDVLASEGWLCASRRHIGGAGDVLATCRTGPYLDDVGYHQKVLLIEVKSTIRPYDHFLPADRQAMVETAKEYGAEPWLYWWPARGQLQRIPASDWPITKVKAQGGVQA